MFSNSDLNSKLNIVDIRTQNEIDNIKKWYALYTDNPLYLDKGRECKRNTIFASLNLGSFICEKIRDLILLEFQSSIENDEELNEIYNNFINNNLEHALSECLGIGSVILKPFFNSSGQMEIDYINAMNFIPLRFENNKLVDCAFISTYQKSQNNMTTYYTLVEIHTFNNHQVEISNRAFKSQNGYSLDTEVSLGSTNWSYKEPLIKIQSERPLFVYYKTNNISTDNKNIGTAFFEKAYNNIREADRLESSFIFEYTSAERVNFVPLTALDENKELSKYYKGIADIEQFGDVSPNIRADEYLKRKNDKLIDIENNLQVSRGTISNLNEQAKTATEILATKEQTFNIVKRYQDNLKVVLIDLIKVCQTLQNLLTGKAIIELDITFNFYDSILAQTEMSDDLLLIQTGILPKYKILMNRYGYTEEEARKYVQEAEANGTQGELI